MITEEEKRKERDYLKTVLYILEKNLQKHKGIHAQNDKGVQGDMRYLWEEVGFTDEVERDLLEEQVVLDKRANKTYADQIAAEERMIESAYFARIDFDDGEDVTPIYIGIASLLDGGHFYVYDWRAPICSMFYDAEMGDASYMLPSGEEVKGKIVLKRQYVIRGDEIKEIFDTDLQIVDDILQKMLSGKATDKMKNIVKTIQKEQNKIIRNQKVEILAVQGPAGSGKTSVALHRIAYLLYRNKDTLTNRNVLIISPNEIFSSYISEVLPSIGEDNVYQTTYRDYVRTFTSEYKIKGDMADIYEKLYTGSKSDVATNSICLKFSAAYYKLIQDWLEENRNDILGVEDIVVEGETIVSREFLQKFASTLNRQLSLVAQAELVNEKIISHLSIRLHKEPKLKAKVIKSLRARVDKIKTRNLYNALYENKERFIEGILRAYNELSSPKYDRLSISQLNGVFNYTRDLLRKDTMPYEDVMNFLLLKGMIQGFVPQNSIKHVVIDEAQDYTILQYSLLSKMFPQASFTILGDTNQCIMPRAKSSTYESIINVLSEDRPLARSDLQYLAKTYRSTYEINTFAKTFVSDKLGYKQIERHGDKVQILKDDGAIENRAVFADAIKQKRKFSSVAIICKTEQELEQIKSALVDAKMDRKFAFVTKNTTVLDPKKIQIIPSYLAKGLEFDSVLVYDANEEHYPKDWKNLLYVISTRALHKLSVYYTGELSELIKNAMTQAKEVIE